MRLLNRPAAWTLSTYEFDLGAKSVALNTGYTFTGLTLPAPLPFTSGTKFGVAFNWPVPSPASF